MVTDLTVVESQTMEVEDITEPATLDGLGRTKPENKGVISSSPLVLSETKDNKEKRKSTGRRKWDSIKLENKELVAVILMWALFVTIISYITSSYEQQLEAISTSPTWCFMGLLWIVFCVRQVRLLDPLPDFDATENKAHLVRAHHSSPVVSLLKREYITKSTLDLEDLQQNCGGRRDDAPKSFGAIYDPGFHATDSLAQKSFAVLETLPTQEQPIDCVPLLSQGRLTPEGSVKQEKSPNLPRVMQINGLEQRVTKMSRYLGELTAQFASSSCWPIGLPDGGHIVLLDPLDQSTKNIEHVARAGQCSLVVSIPEKKMVRMILKRKCRTMRVIFGENHQHFGRRCEGAAKSLGAMHICRKHGINQVPILKQIHKRHGIHQWPFRQKWAARKGYSLVDGRAFEVGHLSMDEELDSRLPFIHMPQFARSSPRALALPDGGKILGPSALSSSEFAATNNRARLVGQDQNGSTASHYKWKNTRETSYKQGLTTSLCSVVDLKHFGCKHKAAVKSLGVSVSMFKSTCRQYCFYWWQYRFENNDSPAWKSFEVLDSLPPGEQSNQFKHLAQQRALTHKHCVRLKKSQDLPRSLRRDCSGGLAAQSAISLPDTGHIISLSEKKIVSKTFKRKCRTMSVLSLEDHQQHVGSKREDAAKFFGEKRICRQLVIHRKSTANRIRREHGTRRWPFKQSAIGLPDGGHILCLSKKKIVRETLKRKCRTTSALSLEYHQHVNSRWKDAVKNLGAKRICRQYGIYRWPFQQNWATMKGYSLRDEKLQVEVMSLSADGTQLVSTLQHSHIYWLGRFSPWPSALPGSEKIVGSIALSSSEFAATNSRELFVGQDQSGTAASDSEKKRTREQEEFEGINTNISFDDLRRLVGRKREDAARSLGVSVSTLKRICRQHGIKRWPDYRRKKVGRPPDSNGEINLSPTCDMENDLAPSQRMATIPHTMESSDDWRNLLPPPVDPSLEGHVYETINRTFPPFSDPAPRRPLRTSPHSTGSSDIRTDDMLASLGPLLEGDVYESTTCTNPPFSDPAPRELMPASSYTMPTILPVMPLLTLTNGQIEMENDPAPSKRMATIPHAMECSHGLRNLLPPPVDPSLEGHVYESINRTLLPCSDSALSQPMPTSPSTTESLDDWRNWLDSLEDPFLEGLVCESINCTTPPCSDPCPSQPMPTSPNTMPTIPLVVPLLTERQDTRSVMLKAIYGDKTTKFQFPLTSGINELKEIVSKRLKEILNGSFTIEYKDDDGDWIFMAHDEHVREYLQLVTSLGNQVTKLKVRDKVPNVCEACGSLKQKRQ